MGGTGDGGTGGRGGHDFELPTPKSAKPKVGLSPWIVERAGHRL